jgi:hypothetical protein
MTQNNTGVVDVISAWEQDPGSLDSPDGGPLIQRPIPNVSVAPLATRIQGASTPPDNYTPGTGGFRYWACADALRRVADFWGEILGSGRRWNPAISGNVLSVVLDEGTDLNAYYDRQALNFFHAAVGGRMVYSGESPDIVCHEFGHAVLDAIRPQLWDVAAFEPPAFHESFGDMSAILTALQLPSVRAGVLQETDGQIYRSSRLSRLAEQLGWAIRQSYPDAVEVNCLRDAVNSLFYKNPDDLATSGPASELSSEPHSFSRVFTGAFFQALSLMFASRDTRDEAALQQVSVDMGHLLVDAVRTAPVVPDYFAQVAGHMVALATDKYPAYGDAVKSAMVRHGLLSVPGVAAIASIDHAEVVAAAGAVAAAAESADLPRSTIDIASFGFAISKLRVVTAGETKRYRIAGAAPTHGDGRVVSGESAATGFFEDLIRRGRLDQGGYARAKAAVVDSRTVKTHKLVKEGDDVVLRRVRIDCGLRATR